MMYATIPAPTGYSSAYHIGTPSAPYKRIQIASDMSVVTAAQVQPYTAHKTGGKIQHSAGSHIRETAARRTSGSGGNISGTPSARFLDHPSMIPARSRYMRVLMYSGPCTRKMSR